MANIFTDEEIESAHDAVLIARHTERVICFPRAWEHARHLSLEWTSVDFPPSIMGRIPTKPGVYVFVVEPNLFGLTPANVVFYIGKATKLRERLRSYVREIGLSRKKSNRERVNKMVNVWSGHLKYYYSVTDSVESAEEIENAMIQSLIPPFNSTFGGEINSSIRAF